MQTMAIKKHIKQLKAAVVKLEAELPGNWISSFFKRTKLRNLDRRIASLEKEIKPNHHAKHKFDPDVE